MEKDPIQKFGVNKCIKKSSDFFSEFNFSYNVDIDDNYNVKQVISVIVDFDIDELKVIDSIKATSAEGIAILGKKIFILLKFKFKILYIQDNKAESVHMIEKETYNCTYVPVTEKLEGTDIWNLVKLKLLIPKVYIEDIFIKLIDRKTIIVDVFVYIELKCIDTYEICFSAFRNKKESDIFLAHEDGSNITCIVKNGNKNSYGKWSPSGRKIAFLSNESGKVLLYTYDLDTKYIEKLVDEWEFKGIASFSWVDKYKIIFSGVIDNTEELYILDTNNCEAKQITYGNEVIKSHSPRVSLDGKRIIFTKSNIQINLQETWVINSNGVESKMLFKNSKVSQVTWMSDNENIVYIQEEMNQRTKIILFNVNTKKSRALVEGKGNIKKLACNLNKECIAYIEENLTTDDIFILDLNNDKIKNITRNCENIRLKEIIWNIDGNKLYYTSEEIENCNVYSIEIETLGIQQITNINARNIKLMYRPRIV